jgi:WD40 repeat protein
VVSISLGGDVCAWDTDTGAPISGSSRQHVIGTLAVAFASSSTNLTVSADGKWVVGSKGSEICVWDSNTGLLVATFRGHAGHISSVSFSPDSKRILSASQDNTIRVRTLD